MEKKAEYKIEGKPATIEDPNGEGYVYLIKPVGHNVYKIGSTTDLERRLIQNSRNTGQRMEYVHYFYSKNMEHDEQRAQIMFSKSHLVRDWFVMSDEEIERFKKL